MREISFIVSLALILSFFFGAFKVSESYSRPHGDCESQAANIAAMHSTIFDSQEHFNEVLQKELSFCRGYK